MKTKILTVLVAVQLLLIAAAHAATYTFTNLNDVPNAAGWVYGQGLGIFWNTTLNAVTHQTTNPLAPGSTLASFIQYGIAGFEEGRTAPPPCPLTPSTAHNSNDSLSAPPV